MAAALLAVLRTVLTVPAMLAMLAAAVLMARFRLGRAVGLFLFLRGHGRCEGERTCGSGRERDVA
jgi:hypothetical protein